MNFDRKLADIDTDIKRLLALTADTKKDLKDCISFTHKFLDICKELGIKKVAIGVSHESIEATKKWGFSCQGSAFAAGEHGGWPAIWKAVELAGVSGGCGNHDQHQLNSLGEAKLVDGCYHLKDGKWKKVS